jgi:hypothetical protein
MSQSNTHEGDILLPVGEDLSSYSDVLVAIYNASCQPSVTRPVANNDYAIFVLVYGATPGNKATVRPLSENREVRVVANGAGNPGDLLVLADGVTTPANRGQVRSKSTLAAGSGTYRLVGIAEEAFVTGQLVKMRPTSGSITV